MAQGRSRGLELVPLHEQLLHLLVGLDIQQQHGTSTEHRKEQADHTAKAKHKANLAEYALPVLAKQLLERVQHLGQRHIAGREQNAASACGRAKQSRAEG